MDIHPLLQGAYDAWLHQTDFSYVLEGEDLNNYYKALLGVNFKLPDSQSKISEIDGLNQFYYVATFQAGGLFAFRETAFPDEAKIVIKRFADVFNFTYTRFRDLQKAEAHNIIIQAENERKTQELEEARQLQLSMLPKELPKLPNLDIAVYMQTATEVGGDYYDFQVGMDGTLMTVIGDATGHGMKAGTVVTITKSLFNSMVASESILSTFEKISQVLKGMKFRHLAMCLLMIKIKGNRLSISSAAMPPALIYRLKEKSVEEILLKGMPLGSMNKFPYKKIENHLNSGDRVLLYSDGLPELANENNEMYGYDRIKTEFHSVGDKEPEEIVDHLKNSASQWANGKDPDDDVTFVVIKVN
jgi:serine phosphatase RsbU (regulator of sigma subunit)